MSEITEEEKKFIFKKLDSIAARLNAYDVQWSKLNGVVVGGAAVLVIAVSGWSLYIKSELSVVQKNIYEAQSALVDWERRAREGSLVIERILTQNSYLMESMRNHQQPPSHVDPDRVRTLEADVKELELLHRNGNNGRTVGPPQ